MSTFGILVVLFACFLVVSYRVNYNYVGKSLGHGVVSFRLLGHNSLGKN
jgi:hypothetical protein